MKINFIKNKNIYLFISIILFLCSIIIIYNKNINLGLEFNGGIEIELKINENIKIYDIKDKLSSIKNLKINYYGSKYNIQIKIKNSGNNIKEIENMIKNIDEKNITILNSTYIGPEINKDIIKKSIIAIFLAIFSMTLYLFIRFDILLSTSAILTLLHDILILLGIISLLNIEINLIIISALFTIFGYSINDTIIIFDRIREYKNIYKNDKNIEEIINMSINSTLSRTINTSVSTILVTMTLIFLSGESLYWFSIILTLGIIIGTYSSIYISALPLIFFIKKK